jgi:hypothetical protein
MCLVITHDAGIVQTAGFASERESKKSEGRRSAGARGRSSRGRPRRS